MVVEDLILFPIELVRESGVILARIEEGQLEGLA